MVGSAIARQLKNHQLLTRSHNELDLTNQANVEKFIHQEKPDQIYLAAAKVGGIYANNAFPAEFIYQNLMIQSNIINSNLPMNSTKLYNAALSGQKLWVIMCSGAKLNPLF